MKIVSVKFKGYNKEYAFFINKELIIGATYEITADGTNTYESPATVIKMLSHPPKGIPLRTITSFELIDKPSKPQSKIKEVFFIEKEGLTTVFWKDGTETTVKCQPGDSFNKEVGIAMAFMKRSYQNSGYYNDEFRRFA